MGIDSGFRLGPWEVRPKLGTLSGPSGTLHLEPKVMGVLVFLAEEAGEVLTRDQFIDRVWLGRIVSDEVLSRCISLLRASLGDNAREPKFIQTVPKIGYRLIVTVEPLETSPATGETTATRPAVLRWRQALAVLAVLSIVLTYFYLSWPGKPVPATLAERQVSVVVLPFVNRSGDVDNEYFSDGLTEELIDRLANVTGLQVVASTSAFSFKNHHADVRSIAEQLGVDYVLEGNVRKDNDQIRISAQLVDAEQGFQVWSDRYDTSLRNIFAVQDEIANGIVDEVRPRLTGHDRPQISTLHPTGVIPAYELLLRGRYHLKRREEEPIRRSIELFRQAIELDPAFGEAYRELARAYALLPDYSYEDNEQMSELAIATIAEGAAIAPDVAEAAHDVLAFVHFRRWEWVDAEQDFRRALAATPNDPNVHQWYSQQLASVGYIDRSLRQVLEARKLDVLSPVVNERLAVAYMWADDNDRARQQFDLAYELGMGPRANPEAYVVLLLRRGEYDEARDLLVDLQSLFARATEWIDPFIAALRDPANLQTAREALALAARERNVSLIYQLGAWVYLGDADEAMDVAFELLHEPAEFKVEFLFAREARILRCHPRFGELVSAIGLDTYWNRYGWPTPFAGPGEVNAGECD
jgi:TolB-like protein/DNA-binding winged helix-turn-helix (wHTH) protein/tetratricopeptide (TPR) repeat protein